MQLRTVDKYLNLLAGHLTITENARVILNQGDVQSCHRSTFYPTYETLSEEPVGSGAMVWVGGKVPQLPRLASLG